MSRIFEGTALFEFVSLANALGVRLDPESSDLENLRRVRRSAEATYTAVMRARHYLRSLPFPGGDVDISGMKAEPVAPTTLSDPEDCIR